MTWADYMAVVEEHLSVDAARRGLEDFRERTMRNAVVDLQRYITAYQQGHTTTYVAADLTTNEYAMQGNLPAGAIPHAFYIYSNEEDDDGDPHPACNRNRLDFWPWVRRQELICCPCDIRIYAYSLSPMGKNFVIHPVLNDDTELLLVWQGLKINFVDADEVPFPEESAEAVAAYVKWRILLEIDKNPSLAKMQFDIYRVARGNLYLDEKAKLDAEKPDEEYGTGDAPPAPSLNQFGAQNVPFLSLITQLVGVDGDVSALSAIPTTGLTTPYLVDVMIGGNLQRWVLAASTAATAEGYQRPNDYADVTNEKVWIQLS